MKRKSPKHALHTSPLTRPQSPFEWPLIFLLQGGLWSFLALPVGLVIAVIEKSSGIHWLRYVAMPFYLAPLACIGLFTAFLVIATVHEVAMAAVGNRFLAYLVTGAVLFLPWLLAHLF